MWYGLMDAMVQLCRPLRAGGMQGACPRPLPRRYADEGHCAAVGVAYTLANTDVQM